MFAQVWPVCAEPPVCPGEAAGMVVDRGQGGPWTGGRQQTRRVKINVVPLPGLLESLGAGMP